MLRAILHAYEGDDRSPVSIMRFCNQKLFAARLDGSFTTAFYATLDTRTGELTWARCGHNPPRLRRADGSVVALDCAGALPLGVTDDPPLEQADVVMHPGDTLVLYTDGITEAFAPHAPRGSRDMFGTRRLDQALTECSGRPSCVVDSIHSALYAHTGVMDRDDDQTLVVVRRSSPDDA
ncbi:MAG: PP2C family protein-serine/threonine phosphatase [Phycisphaerales bacterium]